MLKVTQTLAIVVVLFIYLMSPINNSSQKTVFLLILTLKLSFDFIKNIQKFKNLIYKNENYCTV